MHPLRREPRLQCFPHRFGGQFSLSRKQLLRSRQFVSRHPQVRQCERSLGLRAALGQSAIARLHVAGLPLDYAERMLDACAEPRPQQFEKHHALLVETENSNALLWQSAWQPHKAQASDWFGSVGFGRGWTSSHDVSAGWWALGSGDRRRCGGCCSPGCSPQSHRWQAVCRAVRAHLRMTAISLLAAQVCDRNGSTAAYHLSQWVITRQWHTDVFPTGASSTAAFGQDSLSPSLKPRNNRRECLFGRVGGCEKLAPVRRRISRMSSRALRLSAVSA